AFADLQSDQLDRSLVPVRPGEPGHVELGGKPLVLFSGNDYLGLSGHPRIRRAVAEAAERYGMGPRSSSLVCGYTESHEALEAELAAIDQSEAALVTPTGYAANLSVMNSLANQDTVIFSDALNHASIVDGCRLARASGAELQIYPHGDMDALDRALRETDRPRRLIVTDSVFSMDGDVAPLGALAELRDRHDALLVVDEAHGSLVFGDNGGGVAEAQGVSDHVDVHVGTLSKAFGCIGGFIATSHKLRRWILSRGRAYVYSTSLPVPVVAGARESLRIMRDEPERRTRLWEHVARVSDVLGVGGSSPIFSWVLGSEERALSASRALFEQGLHVPAIRPPTVPDGTARLRITLSAAHTDEDITLLLDGLAGLS
ncbi:MAG: 8-amino-7-oxononanoate synthase, partial [Myxococcota bacterium]|nr:8-amino-7-oxononanoate synthase [Myxococcota bacterium]